MVTRRACRQSYSEFGDVGMAHVPARAALSSERRPAQASDSEGSRKRRRFRLTAGSCRASTGPCKVHFGVWLPVERAESHTRNLATDGRANVPVVPICHLSGSRLRPTQASKIPRWTALVQPMQITLELPEDIARGLESTCKDLPRAALESLALEAYRSHALTAVQLRRLLGFETRMHEIYNYTAADFEQDRETLRQLRITEAQS
jgi:hypothetical protein